MTSTNRPSILAVFLHDQLVGQLTALPGERIVFDFAESYLTMENRYTLSQSFLSTTGKIVRSQNTTQRKAPPFFSNLLPEGALRRYLSAQQQLKTVHDFSLLALLGEDLPGAVRLEMLAAPQSLGVATSNPDVNSQFDMLRFSLAGVQLKFSALYKEAGGLTIPAHGVGGDWIVKLPSAQFALVPENEFSMLQLAAKIGISVPDCDLVKIQSIKNLPNVGPFAANSALAIKRFDRMAGGIRVHIEDFAQVYGIYPHKKYERVSYNNILKLLWRLCDEDTVRDFVRRLTFSVLIGNADMHLKNWSLIYPDGVNPTLAPAYDFVATIAYLPDTNMALSIAGEKSMLAFDKKLLVRLAEKAEVPASLVIDAAKTAAEHVRDSWSSMQHDDIMPKSMFDKITAHMRSVPFS